MFSFNPNSKDKSIYQEETVMVAPQCDDPSKMVDDGFILIEPKKLKMHSTAYGDKGHIKLVAKKMEELEGNKFAPLFEFATYVAEAKMV